MELIFFGINLLLVMAVWHFMLRPTVLDHSRDRLFDLRDDLRASFVSKGWDLGSPEYRRLRDLINGYLRFTEEMSLARSSWMVSEIKKNDELKKYMNQKVRAAFASNDPEVQQYIQEFRKRALLVVIDYMIASSGMLLMFAAAITPIVIVQLICSKITKKVDFTVSVWAGAVKQLRKPAREIVATSKARVAKLFMRPDFIESYSYRRGMAV